MELNEVFKTVGVPTYTYVERESGLYEKKLKSSITSRGNICLLTGPSKTGKTTLYNKVLEEMNFSILRIHCDEEVTPTEFWKRALEKVNFERVTNREESSNRSIKGNIKAGGEFGWKWLSKIIGEINLGIDTDKSETEIREIILAAPSPEHLIPILHELTYFLVVEDFHYLKPDVQRVIFQQWKAFVDHEVSVLIVGTTHNAVDLAFTNKDLTGRIIHIEVGLWDDSDLISIIYKGFNCLKINIPEDLAKSIVDESVGLPILTQSICYQVFADKNILEISTKDVSKNITIEQTSIYSAFHNVATLRYGQFSSSYDILSAGIRVKSNKYNTYNLILLIFGIDPPENMLRRDQIDKRLSELLKKKKNQPSVPPKSSIDNTLNNLSKLQKQNNISLLEWSESQNKLFILEPAFLFYLRWKDKRSNSISIEDLLEQLVDKLDEI